MVCEEKFPLGPITFYNLKYLGERSVQNDSEIHALNALTDLCNSFVVHSTVAYSPNNSPPPPHPAPDDDPNTPESIIHFSKEELINRPTVRLELPRHIDKYICQKLQK